MLCLYIQIMFSVIKSYILKVIFVFVLLLMIWIFF